MSHGLILGRFLPPHAGHVLLARTARQLVDRLTIVLLTRADDPIPAGLREAWLAGLFPDAHMVCLDDEAGMADNAAGIGHLAAAIKALTPEPIDTLFGGDGEEQTLARALGVRHVQIDPNQCVIPVNGADIRADPFGAWRYIPGVVRPHYAKTICLHGPESTGKSTLAPALARHFDTIYLPEYGRTYCEAFGLALTMADLLAIAKTHAAMTRAALRQCNRRLILDTDPLMTAAWAEMLFERSDPWFAGFGETADLYLLLDIDMPWVDDGTRFFGDPARRQRFLDLSREQLERRGLAYAMISGPPDVRLAKAIEAIEAAGLA